MGCVKKGGGEMETWRGEWRVRGTPGSQLREGADIMGVCGGSLGAAPWAEVGAGQEAESCPAALAAPPGAMELG